MVDSLVLFFSQYPHGIATAVLSALPITELRLMIPIATYSWGLGSLEAFTFAVIGNLIPLIPLYFGLDALRDFVSKNIPWATRWIDSAVARAQRKVEKNYARYGAIALCIFTAIPLPFTGLWTATLGAVALKIKFRFAGPSIALGVVIAGVIVTILSAGLLPYLN